MPTSRRTSKRRWGVIVCLGLVVAGFLIGRVTARSSGGESDRSAVSADRAIASSRSGAGAVAAYLRQQAILADPRLWRSDSATREAALRRVAASGSVRRSIGRSIESIVSGDDALAHAVRSGVPLLARSAPLGFRILSYSPTRAVFDVWIFSLVGAEGLPLDLRLARYRAREKWTAGSWHLSGTRTVGEGNAVRFRGAPELSARLSAELVRFERLRSEP